MKSHALVWSLFLIIFSLALRPAGAQTPEPLDPTQQGFKFAGMGFYQTNNVLSQRMPSTDVFSGYVTRMVGIMIPYFKADVTPENLSVVVAVRPGGKIKIWFISSFRPSNCQAFEALKKQLMALPPLPVKGEVAFSVTGTICGGVTKTMAEDGGAPIPDEWKEARVKYPALAGVNPVACLDAVWPN